MGTIDKREIILFIPEFQKCAQLAKKMKFVWKGSFQIRIGIYAVQTDEY